MNKKITISLGSILIAGIIFFLGYLFGRGYADTIKVEREVVKYKTQQLPAIRDTINNLIPYAVINTDTVERIIRQTEIVKNTDTVNNIVEHLIEVDTANILADYYRIRKYNLDFSNDSIGTFKLDVDVNKNALSSVKSEISPIVKTIETTKYVNSVKTLQFYGLIGSSVDLKTNKVQLGIDLRQKYMLGISGIRMNDKYGYTIDLGIKF